MTNRKNRPRAHPGQSRHIYVHFVSWKHQGLTQLCLYLFIFSVFISSGPLLAVLARHSVPFPSGLRSTESLALTLWVWSLVQNALQKSVEHQGLQLNLSLLCSQSREAGPANGPCCEVLVVCSSYPVCW